MGNWGYIQPVEVELYIYNPTYNWFLGPPCNNPIGPQIPGCFEEPKHTRPEAKTKFIHPPIGLKGSS